MGGVGHRAVRRGRAGAHPRRRRSRCRSAPFGAYRLARRVIGLRGPALAAGLAYGVNPVARNAIAEGRLGPLVLFVMLPFLLGARRPPRPARRDARDRSATRRRERQRSASRLRGRSCARVLVRSRPRGTRSAAALFVARRRSRSWSSSPLAGERRAIAPRAVGIAIVGAVGAVVLLFPWPLAYATRGVDRGVARLRVPPRRSTSREVLRFDTGPAGGGLGDVGPARRRRGPAVPRHRRRGWRGRRAAGCSRSSGGPSCGCPARFVPDASVPAPEAGLTLAALGLARRARHRRVGARRRHPHVPVRVAPTRGDHRRRSRSSSRCSAFTADAVDGRWDAPGVGLGQTRSPSPASLADRGRVPHAVGRRPDGAARSIRSCCDDGTGYTLTRNGPGDVDRAAARARARRRPRRRPTRSSSRSRGLTQPPRPAARARWVCATSRCRRRRVATVGRAPAPRRSALRDRSTASSTSRGCRSSAGLVLYENLAWIPLRAVVSRRRRRRRAGRRRPTRRAPRSAPTSRARPRSPPATGRRRASCSGARRTTPSGKRRRRRVARGTSRTFGWANGYRARRARPGVDRVQRPVAALGDARRRAGHLAARRCAGGGAPASRRAARADRRGSATA